MNGHVELKFSQSQFQAVELNWRQFLTKSQMKSAPKLVPFSLFFETCKLLRL